MRRFVNLAGFSNIIYGTGFFLYWALYRFLLPYTELKESIIPLVSHPNWIWVNSIGVFSSIFGIIGLTGMFYLHLPKHRFPGLAGFILAVFGLTITSGQLLWEAYLYKIIVQIDPDLLLNEGPVYSNTFLMSLIIVGGLCFSIGYFIFGFASRSCDYLPSWGLQFIVIGAPLFGLSPLFGPLQQAFWMIGVIVLAAGLVMTGLKMVRFRNL
jgi:hypothetical protein